MAYGWVDKFINENKAPVKKGRAPFVPTPVPTPPPRMKATQGPNLGQKIINTISPFISQMNPLKGITDYAQLGFRPEIKKILPKPVRDATDSVTSDVMNNSALGALAQGKFKEITPRIKATAKRYEQELQTPEGMIAAVSGSIGGSGFIKKPIVKPNIGTQMKPTIVTRQPIKPKVSHSGMSDARPKEMGEAYFVDAKGQAIDVAEHKAEMFGKDDLRVVITPNELNVESRQALIPDQIETLRNMFSRIKAKNPDAKVYADLGERSGVFNSVDELAPSVVQPSLPKTPKIGTQTSGVKLLGPGNPEKRAVEAIQKMKPLRAEQEAIYTAERAQKIQKALEAEKQAGGGTAGFSAKMKQMEGAMAKVKHESIRQHVSDSDIDMLINKINDSPRLTDFEKIPAQKALLNLFDDTGAIIPTESELIKLRKVFNPELVDSLLKNRTFGQKAKDLAVDVLNVPRAIQSSLDLSAPLRQGIVPAMSHPRDFGRSFKKMFSYAASQKKFDAGMAKIEQRPTYLKMREAKLAISDMASHGAREEAFMSNLAEKIPVVGRIVKASDRAYTGFLNNFRADLFDTLYQNGVKLGKADDEKFIKSLGKFINTATGRGDLKDAPLIGEQLSEAGPLLNGLFFSPRLIQSRISLINPVYYAKLDPIVRKEALKTMAMFLASGMAIIKTAQLAGAEVSDDPTSADFGRIKIGNTRYDIWGGFQPYATFLARMTTGKYTSTSTNETKAYGEGFGSPTRLDALYRFTEGKASPVASLGMDALRGHDFEYNKFDPLNPDLLTNPVTKRLLPIIAQDFRDTYEQYGATGPLRTLPGFFGIGSLTYGPKAKKNIKLSTPTPSRVKLPKKIGSFSN